MANNQFLLRQRIITTILALAIMFFAYNYSNKLKSSKKQPKQKIENLVTNVIYAPVKLSNTSVQVQSNGVITAKNKIDIVSRAQGIFENSDHAFRSGVYYSNGEVLVSIDNQEFYANMRASKAQLLQSLTSILADIKFDYPTSFDQWNNYIQKFEVDRALQELPTPQSDREKAFINGKNIVTQFYNIKALEIKNNYYKIRAPFNGILSENLVNKGALINAGQKLGTFIDPSVYEMEVKINPSELSRISVGKKVELNNSDNSASWSGKISRINKIIDPQSQSAIAIVELRGKSLREGMFLQAKISTKALEQVAEVPRSMLMDEQFVYIVEDSVLIKQAVEVLHVDDKNVFVSGLEEGSWLLQKLVTGAFDGMKVNPINLSE